MEVVVNVHARQTTTSEKDTRYKHSAPASSSTTVQSQPAATHSVMMMTIQRDHFTNHTAFQPVNMVEEDVNFL